MAKEKPQVTNQQQPPDQAPTEQAPQQSIPGAPGAVDTLPTTMDELASKIDAIASKLEVLEVNVNRVLQLLDQLKKTQAAIHQYRGQA